MRKMKDDTRTITTTIGGVPNLGDYERIHPHNRVESQAPNGVDLLVKRDGNDIYLAIGVPTGEDDKSIHVSVREMTGGTRQVTTNVGSDLARLL